MLAHDTGVLAATTAFGKTVVGAVADRPAWRQHARARASAPTPGPMGRAAVDIPRRAPASRLAASAGGRSRPTGLLDVAVIQSLVRKGVVDDCVADYGHLIVDECHHLSAHSFEQVARQAKARFVIGLSATVARKDGHHPIIFMQCGPVRYRVQRQSASGSPPV